MNEFKYPVREIIQAVEEIQTRTGPTVDPVSDFIRMYKKNLEDPQKDKFVLKTIKTLKKLAEDGILRKKGKRYILNTANCGDEEDEDDDDDEDEESDPCGEKKEDCKSGKKKSGKSGKSGKSSKNSKGGKGGKSGNEPDCSEDMDEDESDEEDTGPCCDPGGDEDQDDSKGKKSKNKGKDDEEEEEEEDEEDSDEEDEDDDTDCDEGGHQERVEPREIFHSPNCQRERERKEKDLRERKNNFSCKSIDKLTLKTDNTDAEAKKTEAKDKKGPDNKILDPGTEKKGREGENFAFCVRDFIDSLYRAKSNCKLEEDFSQMDAEMLNAMDAEENNDLVERFLKDKKRKTPKKNKPSRPKYRSRSPLKKNRANGLTKLKRETSDPIRIIRSQYSNELMDAEIEKLENEKDIEIEYESFRPGSPFGASPSGSRADVEGQKSNVSIEEQREINPAFAEKDKIFTANDTAPPNMITAFEVDEIHSRTFNAEVEENGEEFKGQDLSFDDININDDDDKTSFCSNCDETI